ncbi:MAG: hypothetical protein COA94_00145 [Rickettsiales bacterium]|nr:MAG: hypothetical protein COA94_00145 [Rickettsiales bacterium]
METEEAPQKTRLKNSPHRVRYPNGIARGGALLLYNNHRINLYSTILFKLLNTLAILVDSATGMTKSVILEFESFFASGYLSAIK